MATMAGGPEGRTNKKGSKGYREEKEKQYRKIGTNDWKQGGERGAGGSRAHAKEKYQADLDRINDDEKRYTKEAKETNAADVKAAKKRQYEKRMNLTLTPGKKKATKKKAKAKAKAKRVDSVPAGEDSSPARVARAVAYDKKMMAAKKKREKSEE